MGSELAIGVDIGGTKMLAGVVGPDATVVHRSYSKGFGGTAAEIIDSLEAELRHALERHQDVEAIGLAVPSTIDRERGIAINTVHLPLIGVPVRELIEQRIGLPVFLDNDGNAAALAEHTHGAARGAVNAVLLTIGTGIGGGLILGGRVYRGSSGAGAELGHVVIEMHGPECRGNCRNRGCVEIFGSGTAIAKAGALQAERHPGSILGRARATGDQIDGPMVTTAASAGDEAAIAALDSVGRAIGVGLSSFANIFQPDVIVLGGGAMAAGELLLAPARSELRSRALVPMNETPVVAAQLGPEAGMIGAAEMARAELRELRDRGAA